MKNKIIQKPWGYEEWITEQPYALKKIFFKAGNRTSLQVHRYKTETNFVIEGTGRLLKSKEKLDIPQYLLGHVQIDNLIEYENSFEEFNLIKGFTITLEPGYVHRVYALTDLTFLEASTTELDDVIRLHDDSNRPNGKIDKEHQ